MVERLGQEGAHQVVGQRAAVEARLLERRRDRTAACPPPSPGSAPACRRPPRPPAARACSRRAAITSASSLAPAASKRRSSSSSSARATVSTSASGSSRRAGGTWRSIRRAASRSISRSLATRRSMPGPQHLHRHLAPVGQGRRMGLGQRGGGDRLAEGGEEAVERHAQRRAHLGLGDRRSERAAAGPSAATGRRRTSRAEDVGAGGEHLAELDGHRPQPLQRRAPAARRAGPCRACGPENSRKASRQRPHAPAAGAGRSRAGSGRRRGPGPRPRPISRPKAASIAHRPPIAQPWCRAATPPVKLVQLDAAEARPRVIRPAKLAWSGKRRMLSTRYW